MSESRKRWRVKASRISPTWFHACEVWFVEAASSAAARALVESESVPGSRLEVFGVDPATPEMERAHRDRMARCAEWLARVGRHENPRGLL